jgi:hypothetical protein
LSFQRFDARFLLANGFHIGKLLRLFFITLAHFVKCGVTLRLFLRDILDSDL